jgi:hypothetical protein
MKLLITIPHFYNPKGSHFHGSLREDQAKRVMSLERCISALHVLFGKPQAYFHIKPYFWSEANQGESFDIDVVICTTGESHLLDQLSLPASCYTRRATNEQPILLGFECHAVLRERLGAYDFYGYLEDDLVVSDPWFFTKLRWFNAWAGSDCLVQPNRYEVCLDAPVRKLYIDAELPVAVTQPYQDLSQDAELQAEVLGQAVVFRRVANPHAGCFFLTGQQMATWAARPYFLDRDAGFISPLESAASLGVMRTFKVYKPAPATAHFLEILHADNRYLENLIQVDAAGGVSITPASAHRP